MVKTQFKKGIERIKCDNGGEFISKSMNEFYKERGIVLETTCPHTPQQNGVVERKHRHLLEIARALRFEASLPTTFWGECILTATYIVNRLPSKRINDKTPYEVLFGQKPEYDHMRVFGCMAYYKNTETNRDKFEPRGKPREPKVFEQEIFEYSSPIPQCDEPHEELAKKMETEGSSIQDNEDEETHSMEDAFEDQLEDSIDERENDIHAKNIHMENHVEPPVIRQEIEEGRPKRQRMQPRHFNEYQVKLPPSIDHTQPTFDQESSTAHPLSHYVSYEHFSNTHKAFLSAINDHDEPKERKPSTQNGCTRLSSNRMVRWKDIKRDSSQKATHKGRGWTTMIPIAVKQRWKIQQLDVNNAFLHGDLEEEVYMKIPQGFSAKDETRVCKLKRSIYGLKQAFRNWLDILQDSGLQGCRPSSFPMEPNLKLDKGEEEEKIDASRYRRLVGRLLYLQVSRPDIAYSVSILSQFVGDPRHSHMEAANRVLRYLKTTIGQGILLPNTTVTDLVAYCDVDWLGCPRSRRSRSGYVLLLGRAPISWKSKKQSVVPRSSAGAEYRSMATAVSEIVWVRWLLKELDVAVIGPTPLFYDNQSAKHIANNPVFHERTKHVEMDCYFVRERVERKEIMPVHINSKQQIANLLTTTWVSPVTNVTGQLGHSKVTCSNLRGV
nr:hypothetical protein [Tanacetum cinerariifolium]